MEIAWVFGVLFGFIGGFGTAKEIDKKPCVIDQQTKVCMVLKGSKQ